MLPKTNRTLKAFLGFQLLLVFALLAYLLAVLLPASVWYEPQKLIVSSGHSPADATVTLARVVHRSFPGEYSVEVRWAENRGTPGRSGFVEVGSLACSGRDRINYVGGLSAPYTSSLWGFAAESVSCASLPSGTFYATACWTVLRPFFGLVPEKQVCVSSDAFMIREPDERG